MGGYLDRALLEFEHAIQALSNPESAADAAKHATIMFGVAAITLDAARAETTTLPGAIISELEQAIALVYAIRCCPAHDISEPAWVLSPKYQRIFSVAGLEVNLSTRHNQAFDLTHIGGSTSLRHLAEYLRAAGVIRAPA